MKYRNWLTIFIIFFQFTTKNINGSLTLTLEVSGGYSISLQGIVVAHLKITYINQITPNYVEVDFKMAIIVHFDVNILLLWP